MRIIVWLFRAFIFIVLFTFALGNQQEGSVWWFPGHEWRTQMVFIVLAAFGLGCAFGVFAMVPSWWRHRRVAKRHAASLQPSLDATAPLPDSAIVLTQPPRDGI
ncbi:MAG: DUF1049 domain-containing protein [Proteobacteria bacterium]|nr:DUF1049 domain-containing protein [Pseudomonadota bacterium]